MTGVVVVEESGEEHTLQDNAHQQCVRRSQCVHNSSRQPTPVATVELRLRWLFVELQMEEVFKLVRRGCWLWAEDLSFVGSYIK